MQALPLVQVHPSSSSVSKSLLYVCSLHYCVGRLQLMLPHTCGRLWYVRLDRRRVTLGSLHDCPCSFSLSLSPLHGKNHETIDTVEGGQLSKVELEC